MFGRIWEISSLKARVLLLVVATLQVCGCQEQLVDPQTKYAPGGLAIMGSSTASGVGASRYAKSWAGLLQEHMQKTCPDKGAISFARPGYTTWQFVPAHLPRPASRTSSDLAINIDTVLSQRPGMVILQLNSNDPAFGYPAVETMANHHLLLDSLRAKGITSIALAPFPRNMPKDCIKKMLAVKDSFTVLARTENVVSVWDSLALDSLRVKPHYAYGDRVHLNDAGHAVIFRQLIASPAWQGFCHPN